MGSICFLPESAVADWHRWLGLHALPHDAALLYVIRGGAYTQAAIGVLLWIMATDVIRYRPLILAVGGIYLAAGPAFYWIEAVAGMPWFWISIDVGSCTLTGAVILTLIRQVKSSG